MCRLPKPLYGGSQSPPSLLTVYGARPHNDSAQHQIGTETLDVVVSILASVRTIGAFRGIRQSVREAPQIGTTPLQHNRFRRAFYVTRRLSSIPDASGQHDFAVYLVKDHAVGPDFAGALLHRGHRKLGACLP